MAEELIVRFIDNKYVSMKPQETKYADLLDKCNGCIFDGMTACNEAYTEHTINNMSYCGHHESIWRLHPHELDEKERRKLNGI